MTKQLIFPSPVWQDCETPGLLMAPVPVEFGGFGLHGMGDPASLFHLLHLFGYADLSLGRIFAAGSGAPRR